MKAKRKFVKTKGTRRSCKSDFSLLFYLCFILLAISISGCATIKYEELPESEKKSIDFRKYSLSYDLKIISKNEYDDYLKLNPRIEKSLRSQGKFKNVKIANMVYLI